MTLPWTRRRFLRESARAAGALALPAWMPAPEGFQRLADDTLRLALVLPAQGERGTSAESAVRGVRMGVEEARRTAELFHRHVELVEVEEEAAGALVRGGGVSALLGGFGPVSARALADVAEAGGVPFLNLGAGDDALRGEPCRRAAFHVCPSFAMRADALAESLAGEAKRWVAVTTEPDGGEAARLRTALERRGARLEAVVPWTGDDPAAALSAIRRAAPDAVAFLPAGDAATAFLAVWAGAGLAPLLALPGGDGVDVPAGIRAARVVAWHPALERFGAEQLNDRWRARFGGRGMDGSGWAGWMAAKALCDASLRARTTAPAALAASLGGPGAQIDGHKGTPLSFRPWDHQLRQPLYVVAPGAPGGEERTEDIPRRAPGDETAARTLLDRLGDGPEVSPCHLDRENP